MDLIASISSQKINTFNFFTVHGILGDDDLIFLFDTGAICPVVGVNSFFRKVYQTMIGDYIPLRLSPCLHRKHRRAGLLF